jgi:hypothetical protein
MERRDADYQEVLQVSPEAVKARVMEFFEGIDLESDGKFKKGVFNIEVAAIETTLTMGNEIIVRKGRSAIAKVNGYKIAEIFVLKPGTPGADHTVATYKLFGELHRGTDALIGSSQQFSWITRETKTGFLGEEIEPFNILLGESLPPLKKLEIARVLGIKV